MRYLPVVFTSLLALGFAASATAQAPKGSPKAQPAPPPAAEPETPEGPSFVSLAIPGLQIASHPNLAVEAIEVSIGIDRVSHTFRLQNKGSEELRLAASVALPDLSASSDGSEAYRLATDKPENPVGLTITANGAAVATNAVVRAYALNVDRAAELKSLNIPLMPFGPENDKALASIPADQHAKLVALGLVSPLDPQQPDAPAFPDWTLSVTYNWEQTLPAQKATVLVVSYKPITGSFDLTKDTASVLDDLKGDACLAPATIKTLKTRVQGKNTAAIPVTELAIASDSPTRWNENATATVSVNKPSADVIVAFCGMDAKSAGQPRVSGTAPNSDDSDSFRVLLIGAAAK